MERNNDSGLVIEPSEVYAGDLCLGKGIQIVGTCTFSPRNRWAGDEGNNMLLHITGSRVPEMVYWPISDILEAQEALMER